MKPFRENMTELLENMPRLKTISANSPALA